MSYPRATLNTSSEPDAAAGRRAATEAALGFARGHRPRFVEELKELVRFPTISAHAARGPDLRRGAHWVVDHLERIGPASVRMLATGGRPLGYGEWLQPPGAPRVLVYGHYDVQPADEPWQPPPFESVVRGEKLRRRDASDDKGQLFVRVKAQESWLGSTSRLPLIAKLLVEGKQEVGSPSCADTGRCRCSVPIGRR